MVELGHVDEPHGRQGAMEETGLSMLPLAALARRPTTGFGFAPSRGLGTAQPRPLPIALPPLTL